LKGLKAETLLLVGGLTDVCVHYTFVDGHQGDYFCRVIEDCVAGSSIEAHDAALRAMEYLQSGARRSLSEVTKAIQAYKE
jgi:nicotinamidase-related amidase